MKIRIKQPASPRAQERELEQFYLYLVEQLTKLFQNQAIKGLNSKTVSKFADAQIGNYGVIFSELAKRTNRKLLARFSNKRIEKFLKSTLLKTNKRSQAMFYQQVEDIMGISTKELIAKEGLTSDINALVLDAQMWAEKLRDETLEAMYKDTLHQMTLGNSLDDILAQFNGLKEKRKNHAKFLAHNTIQNFNSLSNDLRAENLGFSKGIWRTAGDESVRPSHKDRDGKTFELKKGCYSSLDGKHLKAGVDYGCRCTVEYVLDTEHINW